MVFFRFAPMGEVEKTRFERNYTTFVNPAFCAAWKSPPKMVVWNRNRGIRSKGVFSFRPDGESRKNAFWTQLDDLLKPGFLRYLEKPTQNGGKKPKSWNSVARVFFRLAPMGKVDKTRFERNWTTFFNPAFCAAWKSPPKMVVWDRNRGIRSQGCFFVSPRWGKSKKRVLNAIIRPSSTRLFALLGKAHPKWWYETEIVEFDRKGVFSFRPDGESRKNAFWTQLDDLRQPGRNWNSIARVFFVSPRWGKSKKRVLNAIIRPSTRLFALLGKAHPKWWYETEIVEFDRKGVFSFRPDGESRKNAFWTQLDDLRQPGFLRCLEKPTQNGGKKPKSWNSVARGFFRLAPMGKVEKTRFERNWTTFFNPTFCAAWKSQPKMVVWIRPKSWNSTSQGCFSSQGCRPDGESRKNAFWTQLDDLRQPGFLRCLEKPTQNGGMKRGNRGIRSQGCAFRRSPRWGKSKKRVLNAIGRPSSTRLFALLGKAHPKWWYETEIVEFGRKGVFRFAPMGKVEKTRFERNYTTFVNPAFCAAWKSPPKMVVWNGNRGIRSQGCLFVSPRWGKSKKRVLNAIGRPSSTRLFALLGKAHPKWWYETEIVEFGKGVFSRPDGESRKNAFWTQFSSTRLFALLGKAHPKWWYETEIVEFEGCFFVSPRWGKSKKRVLNAIIRPSSTRLFALLGKAHPKWWYETEIVEFDRKGVFSFRPDGESRKNAFWTQLDDLRQPGFLRCLEKPTQNGGMKPKSWNSVDGESRKNAFWTQLPTFFNPAFCAAWKSQPKMVVWDQNRGIRSQGCFFGSRWGKSKKRVLNAIGRPSSTRLFALLGKAHPKWWYETEIVEFGRKGVFSFAPMGKVEKTRFERNWTTFVNPAFCAAWKSPPKMVVWETEIVEFGRKGFFSSRPDGESRKNAFWTQLDDLRQPGFLRCLEKPTQNGGMKPKSWNSIARVFFVSPRWGKSKKRVLNAIIRPSSTRFLRCLEKPTQNGGMKRKSWNSIARVSFRFAPMGKVEKTRFERNWTTFVNPAFCAAWKSPPKMVVWNRNRGIRSQGCFFVSPRWGKSKKRVLNAIGRPSFNPAFCAAWKSPPKMVVWNRNRGIRSQGCFFGSPRWGKSKKRVLNAFIRPSSTRLFALLGKAHPKWWYETEIVEFDRKGVFSFRPDGGSRKNAFWTQLYDLRQPGFLRCLEKPTQNGGMKPKSWNSVARVFFRFAPMGKVEKTRFERNYTTFVNPAFCAAWKSPPKMVVWNRNRGIRSQGCFFGSPRWGKSKKRVLNAIIRPSSTRLFALLGKAHPKWWYETEIVEFGRKGVFSVRPDGESRKNAFWTHLYDLRQPGFLRCLEKPTQNGGMKPKSWNSIARVFFRFAPMGEVEKTQGCFFGMKRWGKSKKRVLNAIFVNPAFCAAWKSPPKMVVWNRNFGIRSQGCFFVSPRWGKSQLYDLRQPGFLRCLEKPTQNGGMKPKSWNSIARVSFRFAPMGKVEKTRFERNWTTFVNPAFCSAWKSPPKMVVYDLRQPGFLRCLKRKSWNSIARVSFRFARMGKVEKTRFERNWTTFVNPAFCAAWKSPPKMVVRNRNRGIRSQGCFFRLAPMGKVEKTRFERNWTTFFNPTFCAAWKSQPKMVVWDRNVEFDRKGVFRFAPMGEVEKTRFERNYTTFVNPDFCAAWKSPPKMVVWNGNRGIRSQGCLFVSPRWRKSKKRVLNAIGRPSSTRLFALLGKAHPKWWYETEIVEFGRKGVFSVRPDGESRKNAFWTHLYDLRQPGFLRCLEKPTQNGGMKPKSWNSVARVFFRFAPMGKVEKTRFERIYTTFVNPAFCAAWKSPPKMVVWNRNRGIRSQGCFFVSPRWGKSKKRVLNAIIRPSSTRLFALLGKAHPKWWYETEIVEFGRKGVFSFRPDGESRKNAFWTQLYDLRQPGFLRCLEKPTQNGGMKPKSWNSIPRVFIRFAPMGKVDKTCFERNWTTFVNPAFCAAWKSPAKMVVSWNSIARVFFRFASMGKVEKTRFERNWTTFFNLRKPGFYALLGSPPKMVVWNWPRGIRSQGCFIVSLRWGKSKKRVLNAIGRPS